MYQFSMPLMHYWILWWQICMKAQTNILERGDVAKSEHIEIFLQKKNLQSRWTSSIIFYEIMKINIRSFSNFIISFVNSVLNRINFVSCSSFHWICEVKLVIISKYFSTLLGHSEDQLSHSLQSFTWNWNSTSLSWSKKYCSADWIFWRRWQVLILSIFQSFYYDPRILKVQKTIQWNEFL